MSFHEFDCGYTQAPQIQTCMCVGGGGQREGNNKLKIINQIRMSNARGGMHSSGHNSCLVLVRNCHLRLR
jgi:hypothetical protein